MNCIPSIRKEGFYRIKLPNGDWTIAEWVNNGASSGWYLPGYEDPADEDGFERIGDKVFFLCGYRVRELSPSRISSCGGNVEASSEETFRFCPYCGGRIVWK